MMVMIGYDIDDLTGMLCDGIVTAAVISSCVHVSDCKNSNHFLLAS
jgi:hypothetical protein